MFDNPAKSRFGRYIVYILTVSISVLLLVNVFLIYFNSKVIERNKQLQEQTEKIKVNVLDMIRRIHQVDLGVRGYALIKAKNQLGATTSGFVEMDSVFSDLKRSLQAQHYPIEPLQNIIDSTHLYFDQIRAQIVMVDNNEMDKFNALLKEDMGYLVYLSYIRFSREVNAFEDQTAQDALRRYNRALRNSYLLQIALFFFTVPALIYMVFLFRKTLKVSQDLVIAEKNTVTILARQKTELERQVNERTREITEQNKEISAQNEEIVSHNEQLVLQQTEIDRHRQELAEKNKKLEEAYSTIEKQVDHQTRDLRKTNLELIERNSRLEQFSYIISHNLRAPIARLVGLSDILNHATSDEERSHMIDLMVKSTGDFDNVIKDLTLILSIQQLNTKVYSELDLKTSTDKVVSILENEIAETKATLEIDFSQAPTVYSLPQYVESILYNLMSNALKYRHPNRAPLITIRSEKIGTTVRIIFSDNGLGINLEKYGSSIFNLYKRFHFHVEGKGLGLYLIRTQVEALGGSISLESKINEGSTFTIDLKNMQDQAVEG
ncbi:MAG TPA: ATP-binding protein [Ohtaekwangia sp.]